MKFLDKLKPLPYSWEGHSLYREEEQNQRERGRGFGQEGKESSFFSSGRCHRSIDDNAMCVACPREKKRSSRKVGARLSIKASSYVYKVHKRGRV